MHSLGLRTGALPDDWSAAIDAVVADHPALAVMASVTAGRSNRGLDRILDTVRRARYPASHLLRQLAFGGWPERLSAAERGRILDVHLGLREAGDRAAAGVGVELVVFSHLDPQSLDPDLVPVVPASLPSPRSRG